MVNNDASLSQVFAHLLVATGPQEQWWVKDWDASMTTQGSVRHGLNTYEFSI